MPPTNFNQNLQWDHKWLRMTLFVLDLDQVVLIREIAQILLEILDYSIVFFKFLLVIFH